MRYLVAVSLLFLVLGCDSATYERDGLEFTVINQTTASWKANRTDTGDSWTITGDTWYRKFRCFSSGGCSFELVFKPLINPPGNCQGWEKKSETIRVPDDYNRTKKIELDEYDLDPLPNRCERDEALNQIRKKYSKK